MCQGVGYEMLFVAKFKDRLISCYKQNWHSEESDEKYKWFYSFKNLFVGENYLCFITTKRFHGTLTRFRLRACCLRSHKVWFLTEASENSSCPVCGYLLEEELHVLFQCQANIQINHKYCVTEPINQPNWSHVRNIPA